MDNWRLVDDFGSYSAAMNLAIDEAIFLIKTMGETPPTIRFWQNNRAAVVGYSQSVEAEVNFNVCRKEGIEVVRRFSGGGAVYQDLGNLNYSITIETEHSLIKSLDVTQSLKKLCSGVLMMLETLGTKPCFESPSNILINNKKVSGNAQARRKKTILHHGTILVNANLDLLVEVLNASNRARTIKGVASKKSPVTNLSDELGWQISIEKVKESLQQGFEHAFSVHLLNDSLSQTEKELAKKLYVEKYSKKEWNCCR
jgi:lipoyltransferase/lipoate-protein ligase